MPKDVYYFKHDANANADLKIKAMRKKYGWEGYGWYWYLIETLRTEDGHRLNYGEFIFGGLAEDMKCDSDKVKGFIDDCIEKFHLLNKNNNFFYSERLNRDMETFESTREKFREAGRRGAEKRFGSTPTKGGASPSKPEMPKGKRSLPIEDIVIPTTSEIELIEVLKVIPGWDYKEDEDLVWLRGLINDYPNFTVANLKACCDYHSDSPVAKGPWKNRFRQWLKHEIQYRDKEEDIGAHQESVAQRLRDYDPDKPLR